MMSEKEIGAALLDMTNAIIERTGVHPYFSPTLDINNAGRCCIQIYCGGLQNYTHIGSGSGDTGAEAMEAAWAIIQAMPSRDEHLRNRATAAIGAAIEACKMAGYDADFINPLAVAMKALSENAITDQSGT